MSERKLLALSDFEWVSAARYIIYISSIANLEEINSSHVVSFPLGKMGPERLLRQKESTLVALEGNRSSIERFVGEYKEDLGREELAVLRSIYMQYKGNAEVVRGHIDIIGKCLVEIELGILQSQGVSDDEELF